MPCPLFFINGEGRLDLKSIVSISSMFISGRSIIGSEVIFSVNLLSGSSVPLPITGSDSGRMTATGDWFNFIFGLWGAAGARAPD